MKQYLSSRSLKKNIILGEILTALLFILWLIHRDFSLLVWTITLLNFHNMLFAFVDIKSRIYFLFFNLTIFLFLVSRPFLDMLYNYKYYNNYTYNIENGTFALLAIGCSLLSLVIGMFIYEKFSRKKVYNQNRYKDFIGTPFIKNLQVIALTLFLICLFFNLISGLERIFYIQNHTYYEYHANFQTRLPLFVKGIRSMLPISLIIYLVTMPPKKNTIILLTLYVLTTVPNLIVGTRSAISEALIFCFLYFYLRDSLNRKITRYNGTLEDEWVTKPMKIIIAIAIPIIMISFSAINYIRFDSEKMNDMNPIVDFVYNQGVSYTTITRGYDAIPNLPNAEEKNYTFGLFIDYVNEGTPAQVLFGAEGLGSGNNEAKVFKGNNFAHSISYYLYGEKYFEGLGAGSSYIIELYADYGFIGIIVFNLLLGSVFGLIGNISINKWFLNIILLRALMDMFFMPRANPLGWLTFILSPQFWLPIIFCWLIAKYMCNKKVPFFNIKR